MAYIKLDVNNVVVYKTPYAETGTIEAPDSVVCGMVKVGANFAAPIPSAAEAKAATNAIIRGELAAADLKIIRAIVENDRAIIVAYAASQATLRAQLIS